MNAYICVYIHIQCKIGFHMAFPNSVSFLYQISIEIFGKLCEYWGGRLLNLLLYYILLIYFCVSGDWILQREGFTTELQFPPSNCLIFKEQNCFNDALS